MEPTFNFNFDEDIIKLDYDYESQSQSVELSGAGIKKISLSLDEKFEYVGGTIYLPRVDDERYCIFFDNQPIEDYFHTASEKIRLTESSERRIEELAEELYEKIAHIIDSIHRAANKHFDIYRAAVGLVKYRKEEFTILDNLNNILAEHNYSLLIDEAVEYWWLFEKVNDRLIKRYQGVCQGDGILKKGGDLIVKVTDLIVEAREASRKAELALLEKAKAEL